MAATGFVAMLVLLAIITTVCGALPPPTYEVINERNVYYKLPKLRYGLGDLEPFITEQTVREHYFGIQFVYLSKMNSIIQDWRRNVSNIIN